MHVDSARLQQVAREQANLRDEMHGLRSEQADQRHAMHGLRGAFDSLNQLLEDVRGSLEQYLLQQSDHATSDLQALRNIAMTIEHMEHRLIDAVEEMRNRGWHGYQVWIALVLLCALTSCELAARLGFW